ncbi:MAG: hypothetical protein R8M45_05890 [Ghiorsea sp.]
MSIKELPSRENISGEMKPMQCALAGIIQGYLDAPQHESSMPTDVRKSFEAMVSGMSETVMQDSQQNLVRSA